MIDVQHCTVHFAIRTRLDWDWGYWQFKQGLSSEDRQCIMKHCSRIVRPNCRWTAEQNLKDRNVFPGHLPLPRSGPFRRHTELERHH